MDNTLISFRIDKYLKEKMKAHEDVNWSAVLRRAVIENLENKEKIDLEKRKRAIREMDRLRKMKVFDGGRDSISIIREWRNKRR